MKILKNYKRREKVDGKEFWLWDYRAEDRWHRSTVFLDEKGYSTDGNYYPVIGLAEKKRVEDSKIITLPAPPKN